jgi:hypothetical protein
MLLLAQVVTTLYLTQLLLPEAAVAVLEMEVQMQTALMVVQAVALDTTQQPQATVIRRPQARLKETMAARGQHLVLHLEQGVVAEQMPLE